MAKRFSWLALPPVVMAVSAAGMWLLRWLVDGHWQENEHILLLAAVLAAMSLGIMLSASLAFRRAGTTLHPQKLQQVKVLIVSGIFRFSRNPVYLGQLLLLAAWALVLGGWGVWWWWLLYFSYLHSAQIPREERFLAARFGADYQAFCQRVRRWL
ncbi:protein-S-isoprenylcysteine O-methyltransferase Ste14 [Serratia fonticola]|jgi:protein-S-isoprenylcysteine O-methyltransferase Ste14|uniref:Protein-S-isoprenylcysteine O-methyltransferase Ste14 n=1 Tax=Serratia fonticola TaxID=47917 RepID=A0A542BM00_SERFO|nr:methyltransferase [Serratia fonticola]TQI79602.1 protein-S-isoprenylcysteine O-methyltransferase Ste14 [Serratia fonticola]TQI98372.1 protein-S-isoprenylcysteine O-methyltransferase Ste14 [Serratia fonticola]TVZ67901.1 protein-S-isoprenylcysteine O-methyltransferase Ste14 [Serratia fonticola]